MSLDHKKKTIESMLRYHARNNGPETIPTLLSGADLKQIGAQEFQGKYTYQIHHEGRWRTFELVPRAKK